MFSLTNISGLVIGISASLVIYLVVQHEWSYEKFHNGGDRIFSVVSVNDIFLFLKTTGD